MFCLEAIRLLKAKRPPGPRVAREESLVGGCQRRRLRSYKSVAGWSSPVARQAHNLKVVGSNPTPATNKQGSLRRAFFVAPDLIRGAPSDLFRPAFERVFLCLPKIGFSVPATYALRRDNATLSGGAAKLLRWLRGQDLNLRPSGYEPDELPGCSTPRQLWRTAEPVRKDL